MTVSPASPTGLDLSWLNIDEEWGAHATPGRKGLTLEDLNVLSYGNVPQRVPGGLTDWSVQKEPASAPVKRPGRVSSLRVSKARR